jgi:2-keto-4-pentenoate hydratase/2-oxohepta-3-ene-1,7-dioic acid hydratase in catechol pathway
MIFGVAHLVSFASMGITLMPGDIIYTGVFAFLPKKEFALNSAGTPSGVNLGKANPVWLTNGDIVETGTENIGTCTNKITYV